MKKSTFFRIAKAGATADGRAISKDWITQMAESYDPKVYTARINLEHIKGIHPDWGFRNLGDVLALKTEQDGKELYLLAQIAPTDELIAYTNARQKNFTSVEVNPNFAETGKAYLVGLAVTDNPASLGTDYLQFAAKHPTANIFTGRKADPQNFVCEALEFSIQLAEPNATENATQASQADAPSLEAFNSLAQRVENLTAENAELKANLTTFKTALADIEEMKGKFKALETAHDQAQLAHYASRPLITGAELENGFF